MFGQWPRYCTFPIESSLGNLTTTPMVYYNSFYPSKSSQAHMDAETERKKQRAAVQSKRHKSRTFYKAPNKEVPAVLKHLVNKTQ